MKFNETIDSTGQNRKSIRCFDDNVEANEFKRPLFYIMLILGLILVVMAIVGAYNQDLLVDTNVILAFVGLGLALVISMFFYFKAVRIPNQCLK